MSTPRAIFAGLATLDVVQSVDQLPAANQKIVARDFVVAAGGPAANAAVAFAACRGLASLVTALPPHPLSQVILADLGSHGVDTIVAASYDGQPITASILVTASTGERAIVSPSSAATSANPAPASAADMPDLDGVGAVLIDGYFRAISLRVAREAKARGIPVILDGGSFRPHTPELLPWVDIAIVSDDFAPPGVRTDAEAVLDYLAGAGVRAGAVSRGENAIVFRAAATTSTAVTCGTVPVPHVPVADTLGAGDFLHGAFTWRIAALGRDDERLAEDLAFAAEVASRSVQSFGTRAWLEA